MAAIPDGAPLLSDVQLLEFALVLFQHFADHGGHEVQIVDVEETAAGWEAIFQ